MTDFQKLIEILTKNQVEFVLIGGLAAIVHGCTTATSDLDIVYKRESKNYKKIVKALQPLQVSLRGAPKELPFIFDEKSFNQTLNFTLITNLGAIDLLAEIPGFTSYDELIKNSETITLFNHNIHVISLEALIENKKKTGRPKDQKFLPELEALKKFKK